MEELETLDSALTKEKIRLGYVEVPMKMTTKRMIDVVFDNFIPIASEIDEDRKVIIYLGISDHFEEVEMPNVKPDIYIAQLREMRGGVIKFDKFIKRHELVIPELKQSNVTK